MAKAKRSIPVKSIRSLAGLVGKSASAVRKWLRDDRWPFARFTPWTRDQVPMMKAWAKMYRGHNPAEDYQERVRQMISGGDRPPTKTEQAKLWLLAERAAWIKQRREREAGKLHRNDECLKLYSGMVLKAKASLQALGRSLRNSLIGQDGDAIERIIDERAAVILKELELHQDWDAIERFIDAGVTEKLKKAKRGN